jgi:hypothetical protein
MSEAGIGHRRFGLPKFDMMLRVEMAWFWSGRGGMGDGLVAGPDFNRQEFHCPASTFASIAFSLRWIGLLLIDICAFPQGTQALFNWSVL